jgi:hypothetical protein
MAEKYRHGAIRGEIFSPRLPRRPRLSTQRTMRQSKRRAEQGHAAGMARRFHLAESASLHLR